MSRLFRKYQPLVKAKQRDPVFGLDSLLKTVSRFTHSVTKKERRLLLQAQEVNQLSQTLSSLTDEELTFALQKYQSGFKQKRYSGDEFFLSHALAHVVETCERTLHIRPFDVQIMGALALYQNYVVEMKPGEGKTITAGLAAILKGWCGLPCHVVTTNDYLAARDVATLKPLFERCNVTVGAIVQDIQAAERKAIYRHDVVYATSKELLADFLRDQIHLNGELDSHQLLINEFTQLNSRSKNTTMRGLHSVIIDEADSVLSDEAITPLIISVEGQNHLLKEAVQITKSIIDKLQLGIHYTLNSRYRDIELNALGKALIEDLAGELPSIWKIALWRDELIQQALIAREFFIKEHHYTIIDEKLVIVDEKTGRLMHGRTWRYGLQQAIEAKENIALSNPSETQASLSFQHFFRLYANVAGMSGTLHGLKNEFWHIYGVHILTIPPRFPSKLTLLPEVIFPTNQDKWSAVVAKIQQFSEKGLPVLVGTRSIQDSEELAEKIRGLGFSCNVLNALYHEQEAQIIALAGQPYAITIATNMAGRGTDILVSKQINNSGGLHVISTELYESRRIDWQLYGRSGRQGQQGKAICLLSLEDELLITYCPASIRTKLAKVISTPMGQKLSLFIYRYIQKKAERIAFMSRKNMLQHSIHLKNTLPFANG
ncbi:MAG: DEAD/DEAH box helicase [Methylococcales bacterium]|nr:DEAD/DEAH box helicase [Methylococcales bacterium]